MVLPIDSPINSIETLRLRLRVPELADAEAFMRIFWDPELVARKQVTLTEPPGGLDLALRNTKGMLRQWEQRGYGHWAVVEKATGQVIGVVGFYHPEREWPGVDLGWLIHRSRWNQGFATEAATAALSWMWKTHRNRACHQSHCTRRLPLDTDRHEDRSTIRARRCRPRACRTRARLRDYTTGRSQSPEPRA